MAYNDARFPPFQTTPARKPGIKHIPKFHSILSVGFLSRKHINPTAVKGYTNDAPTANEMRYFTPALLLSVQPDGNPIDPPNIPVKIA